MNLDHLISQARNNEPTAAEIEQAAARVRARLFPKAEAADAGGAIRDCAGFTTLIPAYLAGTLDASRRMLLEAHTHECVACRKALAEARTGARQVIKFPKRQTRTTPAYAGWAIAATALLTVSGASWVAYHQFPSLAGGPRATVESMEGGLFKVAGNSLTPLAPGAELGENDIVRTARNSTAVLRLNDGSKVELNQRAQLSVSRSLKGNTVHLALGNIIVEAAKQRSGALQVVTADCNVQVKGTVFAVDAGTKGSRVAVVEGTVWVDHGQKHEVLHRGDTTSTAAEMAPVPIHQEFEWSRNSQQYTSLLADFTEIKRQLAAIPAPGLRYESNLLDLLPPDVLAVAAIPNVGTTLAEASQIFHDRLKQSEALATWWNSIPQDRRTGFERTLQGIQTASAYLGDEILIVIPGTLHGQSPVLIARAIKPGLEAYIRSQLPAEAKIDGYMRFDNGIYMAASNPADLARMTGGFRSSALYQRMAPSYQQGASWLFGADLARLPEPKPKLGGIQDARFLIAESRTVAGLTENHASVTFSKDRTGVASWLSAPGPMGSLDFVSPDAGFAASTLLKNPTVIVDDIGQLLHTPLPDALKQDIAGTFGGEVTVALDGPLLPFPSWKLVAEVYYPDRLQSSLTRLVSEYNANGEEHRMGNMQLTQSEAEGRIFYRLGFEKAPFEADWTFVDGYWVAAANRELLVRAIQNRQTGYTLPKSATFRGQIPHDASANFSAVVYHRLGKTLAPIANIVNIPQLEALSKDETPGLIAFWAQPDRIDVATRGGIFGMNIESLLALQGAGPMQMLSSAVSSGKPGAKQ